MEVAFKYGKLMAKLSRKSIDAEATFFGPFILIMSLLAYLAAFSAFFVPVPLGLLWQILMQFTAVITTATMFVCGLALVYASKPKKVTNLLWLPFLYFYWSLQAFIALYAVLLILLRRPRKWTKTEKKGVVRNSALILGDFHESGAWGQNVRRSKLENYSVKSDSLFGFSVPCRGLVSIVIPALNEEDGVGRTLSEIPVRELKSMGFDSEIIIVDGHSVDRTREIAKDFGAKVLVEARKGYGRAYKTGFSCAKGDFIVTLDADTSYPASEVPRLLEVLEGRDLVFLSANRFGFMKDGAMNLINRFGNKLLSLFVFVLFSIRLSDSQSGMWVFRKEVLRSILPNSDGMPFSEEIKIKAFRCFKAMEVPTAYRKRRGQAKLRIFKDGFKNMLHLFKLRILLSLQKQRTVGSDLRTLGVQLRDPVEVQIDE